VTAALMADVIATLVSFQEAVDVSHVAVLTSVTMLFGYLEEKTVNVPLMFRPHYLGYVPFLAAWYYITDWFYAAEGVPDFVVAIYAVQFVLFSCFGVVQMVYTVLRLRPTVSKSGRNEASGVYNLLSLVSKTSLVLLCYGGLKNMGGDA